MKATSSQHCSIFQMLAGIIDTDQGAGNLTLVVVLVSFSRLKIIVFQSKAGAYRNWPGIGRQSIAPLIARNGLRIGLVVHGAVV